ncbi:hypothetical protein MFLAVUS_008787 [Mucor flavus]|uniref:F-box domain-containing protein n=1 Tax=Mucor flavus TaxID=439312 RepID=A0ABP9Z876_9FUNG
MSETSITKVPREIWKLIFSFCLKEHLPEYMRVCNSWHMSAKRVFYEEVTISDEATGSRFTAALVNYSHGIYVRHLKVHQKEKPRRMSPPLYSRVCIQYIFRNCYDILTVDLDNCNPYYFLRSLIEVNLDKLKQIKITSSIKTFKSPAVKRYFLLANQLHRKSIVSLDVPDIPDIVWTKFDILSKQDYLSQFIHLEYLTINQSMHVFISFTKIVSSLPKLKSLHYISLSRSLGVTDRDILNSSKVKYTNFETLSLDVYDLSANDVEYITSSLPNLKTLSLNVYGLSANDAEYITCSLPNLKIICTSLEYPKYLRDILVNSVI